MAAKLSRKNTSEPQYEDFEPVPDLQESPERYILLINLPGFKKEDFRVQVDGLGNLTVKGQKPIGDNKFKRLSTVFLLPHDSDIEKIRGKFEGETLSLTLPKREKVAEKLKEEEKEPPKEEAKSEQKKEETKDSEKKEEVETKEEQKTHINGHEQKEEEPKLKEPNPSMYEKLKDRISEKMTKKNEEKKMISWKEKINQEMEDLSNKLSVDKLLDTLNKNKKEIAVGVAAFSIGFLIARKLSSNK